LFGWHVSQGDEGDERPSPAASKPTLSATLSALESMACSAGHFLLPNYCRIPGILGDGLRSTSCDLSLHLQR
jgi:hypothetical protein